MGTLCAATTFKHSGQEKSFICSVTLIEWEKFTRRPILYKEFIEHWKISKQSLVEGEPNNEKSEPGQTEKQAGNQKASTILA